MRTWEWPHYVNALIQLISFVITVAGWVGSKDQYGRHLYSYVVTTAMIFALLGLSAGANYVLYAGGFWP